MSTVTTPPAFDWPADVLAAADAAGLRGSLEPLRLATLALFPTLTSLAVSAEPDPEIDGLTFIVFDVAVPRADVPDYVAACHAWDEERRKICELPRDTFVGLLLHRVGG